MKFVAILAMAVLQACGTEELDLSEIDGTEGDALMAVPAFRGMSWSQQVSTAQTHTTKVTLTAPSATQPGDLLLAFIADGDSGNDKQPALAPPSQWTLVDRINHNLNGTLAVYRHRFAAGESQYTWASDRVLNGVAWIVAYSGVDSADPIEAHSGLNAASGGASITTPAVTTATPNALLVASFVGYSEPKGAWNAPADMTQRLGVDNADARSGATFDRLLVNPGKVQVTAEASPRQNWAIAHLLALRPARVAEPQYPTYQGSSSSKQISTAQVNTTNVTLTAPSAAQPGDLLLAFLADGDSGNDKQPALTPPSGWTLVDRIDHNLNGTLAVYRHRFAAGENRYVWAGDRVLNGVAWILAYKGVDVLNPIEGHSGRNVAAGGASIATPSVTTTSPNAMLVASFVGYSEPPGVWGAPEGMARRLNIDNGDARSGASFDRLLAIPGSARVTARASSSQSWAIAHLLALRPASSLPPPPPPPPPPGAVCELPDGQSVNPRFGAEMQDTGDPIAGGVGYSRIPAKPARTVTTKEALKSALSAASSGTIVYVDDGAVIDMSNEANIRIPAGVILASGRGRSGSQGAKLYTTTRPGQLFNAGANVRITGLRFFGPDRESGDHMGPSPINRVGVGAAVLAQAAGLEVDNCEFSGWGYTGIHLMGSAGSPRIHHSYFHHINQSGYGYGIVVDGTGGGTVNAQLYANLFDFYRHGIASTYDVGANYKAWYNVVREHGLPGIWAFDRHGNGGYGGGATIVHHNTFWPTTVESIGFEDGPSSGYAAEVYRNWFFSPKNFTSGPYSRSAVSAPSGVSVRDNFYEASAPTGTFPPKPAITAPTSAVVGETVNFDGSASCGYGHPIRTYQWDFGDGQQGSGAKPGHVFSAPGRYNVELMVTDSLGIPATILAPVTVRATNGKPYLSLWVIDSYRRTSSGTFSKHVLIDGREVWSDSASGDKGWQNASIDLSSLAAGKHTLALKVVQDSAPASSGDCVPTDEFVYWDDVGLSNGSLGNGDFERGDLSQWSKSSSCGWDVFPVAGEVRSGRFSLGFLKWCSRGIAAGCSAQVSREFSK